jgi:hypothetical protein
MAGFVDKSYSLYGGNMSTRIKGQPKLFTVYDEFDAGDSGSSGGSQIKFTTASGALLSFIPINVQNTKFVEAIFASTPNGSESFSFKLNDVPKFPLQRFSQTKFTIELDSIFYGYIFDTPELGSAKKKYQEYKGFGQAKRLENCIIDNTLKWDISSISMSGSDMTIHTSTPVSGVVLNQWAIIRNAVDSSNNVQAFIVGVGASSITVVNVAGLNQAGVGGQIVVLPVEWSGYSAVLVSDLFDQIVRLYCGSLPINYNPDKIIETTGKTLGGGKIDWDGLTIKKAFENIKLMLGDTFDLGVDEYDDFFIRPKETDVQDVLHTGYQVQNPEIKLNLNNVINSVNILRGKSKLDQTKVGSSVGATASDPTSIAKYGLMHKDIEVAGYFSDETCQVIADQIILDKKEPKYSVTVKDLAMRYYPHGYYTIVSEFDDYVYDLETFESLTGWSTDPDFALALNNSILLTGAYSMRISLGVASDGTETKKTISHKVFFPKKIYLWGYANKKGQYVNFGYGKTSFTENLVPIYANTTNAFFCLEIDVTNYTEDAINEIGFQFHNTVADTVFYVDNLQILDYSTKRYTVYTKKITYRFLARKNVVDIEFSDETIRSLEDFMAGIKAQTETSKLLLRES